MSEVEGAYAVETYYEVYSATYSPAVGFGLISDWNSSAGRAHYLPEASLRDLVRASEMMLAAYEAGDVSPPVW